MIERMDKGERRGWIAVVAFIGGAYLLAHLLPAAPQAFWQNERTASLVGSFILLLPFLGIGAAFFSVTRAIGRLGRRGP